MSGLRWLAPLALLVAGCASLPPLEGRRDSFALAPSMDTRLGAAVAPIAASHPGRTGVHSLPHPHDGFAARGLLAAAAERSIDAQYYIWHDDETGLLLYEALSNAARRGVRVRILVDDQNTGGEDKLIAALAAQRNVEMRLYNPFANRSARALGYLGDFARLNRRMHNKSFTVDGEVTVVGGRNIGNEYFGAGTEIPFLDLDVLAIGAAVREVSAEFDLYWNSASAYPAADIVGTPTAEDRDALSARFAAARADPDSRRYLDVLRDAPLVQALLEKRLDLEWVDARVVRDDPAKTLNPEAGSDLLLLSQLIGGGSRPHASLDIISPYFVPAERGSAHLEDLARNGVRVRVLTNSLEATDVAVVHAGYAKRRCALARAGVRLYELKPAVEIREKKRGITTSSSARLHAKTYAADGERIFVGSFNFDPRSALLNTEMGLVIESRTLAGRLAAIFDQDIVANAYEVRAVPGDACVEWIERTPGGEVRHATEPHVSWGRRAWLGFLTLLPIDWML